MNERWYWVTSSGGETRPFGSARSAYREAENLGKREMCAVYFGTELHTVYEPREFNGTKFAHMIYEIRFTQKMPF